MQPTRSPEAAAAHARLKAARDRQAQLLTSYFASDAAAGKAESHLANVVSKAQDAVDSAYASRNAALSALAAVTPDSEVSDLTGVTLKAVREAKAAA
jgi:hypothetical protein